MIVERVIAGVLLVWELLVVRPLAVVCAIFYALFISPTAHRVMLRTMLLGALHAACIAMAIAAYIGFYYTWVPVGAVSKDIYFHQTYVACPTDRSENGPYTCSVLLDAGPEDLLAWQNDVVHPLFHRDHQYDVSLELTVAAENHVDELPVLAADLWLKSGEEETLYHAYRTALLIPEPRIVRWLARAMRTIKRPFRHEPFAPTQMLRFPLLAGVVPWSTGIITPQGETYARPVRGYMASHAQVRIQNSYGKNTVQVQQAALRFDARLTGAVYYMYYHPLISLAFFVAIFASVELSAAGTIWATVALHYSYAKH
ncbi:hypothetical protein MVES_003737 [Malassezia vespertilionis]|uniref:Seipin n=1 Tax=Malassezia vespertilionis TaxID=2020962 RepID=A0A2N1J733_9BASI|nr:hypothetical protein MVES_003737 [Malassezia vespertilionis]